MFVSTGITGPRGQTGAKGAPGQPGPRTDILEKDSFLFTRHSQDIRIPECPAGSTQVYSGYSLLFINANNRAHGQDLGISNSTLTQLQFHVLCFPMIFQNQFQKKYSGLSS